MPQNEATEYLTLAQYAAALGKSRRTIQRWLREGVIESDMKLPGPTGDHLFSRQRVADLMREESA